MHKKWSLNIGNVAGIKVFIHWTFFILIGWIFLMHFQMGHGFREGLSGTVFILAVFASVVLHELGHALTARRFKVSTRDITIYPIGGIASLESMPSKPDQELQVALAGPAVNLVIAGILGIILKVTGTFNMQALQNFTLTSNSFVEKLMVANIILAVFNLIPAFPMDGGRIFRALLAMKMKPIKATSVAAKTGQVLAIAFVFFGFFFDFWLVFIGLFIFLGAEEEFKTGEMQEALKDIKAMHLMVSKTAFINPNSTLKTAAGHIMNSNEKTFLVMEKDKVVGILSLNAINDGLHKGKANQKIRDIMQKDFYWLEFEDALSDKFFLLQQNKQNLFPVRKKGKLAGVISSDDLTKWIKTRPYIFNYKN